MQPASVHRFAMASADDLTGLEAAIESGAIAPDRILSVWCKTEGNGLRNDWTKPYTDLVLRRALAARLGVDPDALRERIAILVSGGSEGIVSPHMIVITTETGGRAGGPRGLVAATASGAIARGAIGTAEQGRLTAALTREACGRAGMAPGDARLVLVRAPSEAAVAGCDARVRAASAMGAAAACGEIAATALADAALNSRYEHHCTRAFVVARHDGLLQQVLVIGEAPGGNPAFHIAHSALADPIDSPAVARILAELGLTAGPQLSPADSARVVAVIAKGDAPLSGTVRGLRHVMSIDNDVAMHRHARAAFGALLASVIGHSACLVSGGAEHQGPPEGGFATIIARSA